MSLIYTCELNGVNAFDYLNQLQLHASDVAEHPDWYRRKLRPRFHRFGRPCSRVKYRV
jgi:hypothetical protein